MKLKILFVLCFFSIMTAKAQIVSIANETFESTLSGWTIIPSNSWKADTNFYVSGHNSYRGIVPTTNNAGDTSIIISPIYDLQAYGFVWLTFSHICKVSASDICQIEYREDYIGSTWNLFLLHLMKGVEFIQMQGLAMKVMPIGNRAIR
jgi:hypothetical protein